MISTVYQVLYFTWIVVEIVVVLVTRTRSGKGVIHDRGSMLLLWIVILSSVAACEWIAALSGPDLFPGARWPKIAAAIALLVGLVIRCAAIVTLGKSFSVNVAIRKSQQLTRTGLYRFVRHPSYSGLLLIFLGVGLHSRSWVSLVVLLTPTTAALLYRIHIEEAVLRDAFGSEYVDYSRHTSRLVPGLF